MAGWDPIVRQDSVIGGKYRLGPVIGSGGVAVVHRATHLWTEREVAVKLLDPTLPHFELLREGFLREARATVQLDHPNVVEVLDMGEDNWETVYLVMELLEGPTLRDVLLECRQLSEEYTLSILLPLVDALEKAHQLGIVHRDFKPENIVLSLDDFGQTSPKLLDFGVAEILRDKRFRDRADNVIMGTPQYMSPEQARDESHLVGPHTDVWGVGVVWYECLTGRAPFVGDSAVDVLTAVCESPIDFERVPEAYVPLLRDALGRTPDVRIATLSDFKARIADMRIERDSLLPLPASLSSLPPPLVPSKANRTLSGLGPNELYSAERVSSAADAELATVPLRSHRNVLLGGLALVIAVALSAWMSVRDLDQGSASLPKPAIPEPEAEPAAEPNGEAVEEIEAEPVEDASLAPIEEFASEPPAESVEELASEPPAESVEELASEPVEEAASEPPAEPVEEAAAEPVEEASAKPESKASKPASSKPRRKTRSEPRKKSPTSNESGYGKTPQLVTEW